MNMTPIRIIPIALVLALAACQQQPKPAASQAAPVQAPAMTQQASPAMSAQTEAPAPKPAMPAAKPAAPAKAVAPKPKPSAATAKPSQPTTMAAKSSAPAPAATPAPAKPTATAAPKPAATTAKPEASSPKPVATMKPFSTTRCMACHAIDHDKVGPAWKTVVEKYGNEAALAKDFEAGFKARRVANAIAKWKSKEGLMTAQYDHLIKGHAKEAAHALFMTVKHGKFGTY